MDVRRINYRETYLIRQQMLRPGRAVETCHFAGDDDEDSFHLGAYVDSRLVSVGSFYVRSHPKLTEEGDQCQLRGMATLVEFQNQGCSSAILGAAFSILRSRHARWVWCNARVEASGFYEKMGFRKVGEVFEVPDVGPHYLMVATIDQ